MMNWLQLVVLVAGAGALAQELCTQVSPCPSGYTTNSTLCKAPASSTYKIALTDAEKVQIVKKHNDLRRYLGSDYKVPFAAHLPPMRWDDELAATAQAWACQVPWSSDPHDDNDARKIPSYGTTSIGQNGANGGSITIDSAIQMWYDEIDDFEYGVGSKNGNKIGHFTQVILESATKIGCGRSTLGSMTYFYCNYLTGQTSDDKKMPYTTGSSINSGCSCCDTGDGLCHVLVDMCLNEGVMNYDTGSCDCVSSNLGEYKGTECNTFECNADVTAASEEWACGPTKYFKEEDCINYYNVKYEYCPYMCGLCK